jgi:hypothetical protein
MKMMKMDMGESDSIYQRRKRTPFPKGACSTCLLRILVCCCCHDCICCDMQWQNRPRLQRESSFIHEDMPMELLSLLYQVQCLPPLFQESVLRVGSEAELLIL